MEIDHGLPTSQLAAGSATLAATAFTTSSALSTVYTLTGSSVVPTNTYGNSFRYLMPNGNYVFVSSATLDFDSVAIGASSNVPGGSYRPHSGFLSTLNSISADRQLSFRVSTGTVYIGRSA